MSKKLTEEKLGLLKKTGYSEEAIEYYVNNVNVGIIKNSDVTIAHTDPCGDALKLYLKMNKDGIIEDAKFLYVGCPGLAVSGSALTNLMKGKTMREVAKITENDILKKLGGLLESKLDCPKLAIATLQKAIAKYKEEQKTRATLITGKKGMNN